jgi:hypothetical protein
MVGKFALLSLFHLLRFLIPANPLRRSWIAGGTNEATHVRTFLPGVGSLANYHPFKHNGMLTMKFGSTDIISSSFH